MTDELSPMDALVARDEIRQLAYRYADALDRRDLDLLVSLYRPDARFGAHGEGPDACRAFFSESLREIGLAVLLVANHIIEFDDADNATGSVRTHAFIDDHCDDSNVARFWITATRLGLQPILALAGGWLLRQEQSPRRSKAMAMSGSRESATTAMTPARSPACGDADPRGSRAASRRGPWPSGSKPRRCSGRA